MKTILTAPRLGTALAIGGLALVLGCESVAILPRDDVDRRRYGDRRDDSRRDGFEARRDEMFGRVQEVDERRREIRLRTEDGRSSIIRYDGNTQVVDGNRDLRPESLRSGDEISVRLGRDLGGERYADAIRVLDRRSGWWR